MGKEKIFLCPECFELFKVENKSTYPNTYKGVCCCSYSCFINYKKRIKRLKMLGIEVKKIEKK